MDETVQTLVCISLGKSELTATERKTREKKEYSAFVEQEHARLMRAVELGVPIAAGSDMNVIVAGMTRGQASLLVYDAYAEAGMTPIANHSCSHA